MYYFNGDSLILCLNRIPKTFTVDTFGAVYYCSEDLEFVKVITPEELFRVYNPEKDIYAKGPDPEQFTTIDFMIDSPQNVKLFRSLVKSKLNGRATDACKEYFK